MDYYPYDTDVSFRDNVFLLRIKYNNICITSLSYHALIGIHSVKFSCILTEQTGGTLEEEEFVCEAPHKKVTVAVISSNVMGNGDDELGKILIKGFIYALSQMETHPDTILFYKGGAKLTTEDSESLEDLKKMEEEGVEILTCGTCLKHYGLMEKLMVGKVTDMYTIAERMTGADKVIRP